MVKNCLRMLLFLLAGLSLISCGALKSVPSGTSEPAFKPHVFPPGQYTQKVNNFMVILDASGTMVESYKGRTKFHLAKEVVSHMNQTIPDLRLTAAMRTLGQGFSNGTALVYGLTDYTRAGVEGALNTVSWGGQTPLSLAISTASNDLMSTQGNTAVIIVSDGLETEGDAIPAAQNMKREYGDRLCIYTVQIGDDPQGKDLLERLANAGQCGFAVNAEDILSSEDMAGFVEKVFLSEVRKVSKPLDSDGDGVYDSLDQCPDTPRGVTVDERGCPLDTDGDGVYDYLDKCPNTPKGIPIDTRGCPLDGDGDGVPDYLDKCPGTPQGATVNRLGCWVIEGVSFETAKSNIKAQAYPKLNEVVSILKKNPALKLEIQGHTDNRGAASYNQKLSESRAKAVMEYLVQQGIARDRLTAFGFGFSKPAASNDTPQGRALNRRVEFKPMR
jgi:OOP family OmpA-OmpF porin